MNDRGQYGDRRSYTGHYGRDRALVGIELFHGITDRDTAAAQINTQIQAIASAVVSAAGGDPSLLHSATEEWWKGGIPSDWREKVYTARRAMEKSPLLPLWDNAVSPMLNEWNEFHGDRAKWYQGVKSFFTSWDDYKSWAQRVNDLRDRVEAAGVHVPIPRLQELPKSVTETAEQAIGEIWKIAKWGVIGALAVGGVVVLSSAAAKWRKS